MAASVECVGCSVSHERPLDMKRPVCLTVLGHDSLVEYALRQTLVADALSLQFRLPPAGIPAPVARRSAAIANNTAVVDALVVTSVWAVHLLRTLSQVPFLMISCKYQCLRLPSALGLRMQMFILARHASLPLT